ncbi:glycosyltransferase family 2 protein [Clostridium sp.]|uniref:glycosyltransferase family 2 protein n=1 Tax=Clostridium sp. TaxID=1506 RepID=UPI00261B818F|nr:glycosyltransferase family 2 protein [Clostridium sp.]
MEKYIFWITAIFQTGVFAIVLYYLFISLFGFYKKKDKKTFDPQKRFAMLVSAHNEEVVIGNLVESLKHLDYPKELYDIFVIADNCTDNTAKVAKEAGANVFERFNKEKRGKGFALEWMFDKIFKMETHYDGIAIFDADNLVDKNFLKEMNNKMCEGYKVVQGYIDSKNPQDSWITESYAIAFTSANRMLQLAKSNIGLSAQIGGTGFVVDTDTLKKLGWGATCLTEDLEFSCKLILNGEKVGWAHEAIIYDEKPLTLKASWNQRKRWMQGFADVASRYGLKLLKQAIKKRSFVTFDCLLYLLQPYVTLAMGLVGLLTFIQIRAVDGLGIFVISYLFNATAWQLFCIFQFLLTPFALLFDKKIGGKLFILLGLYSCNVFIQPYLINQLGILDNALLLGLFNVAYIGIFLIATLLLLGKRNFQVFYRYLIYPIYTLTWIPITIQGIIDKDKKEWSHTKHVRQIGIYEV